MNVIEGKFSENSKDESRIDVAAEQRQQWICVVSNGGAKTVNEREAAAQLAKKLMDCAHALEEQDPGAIRCVVENLCYYSAWIRRNWC